MHPLTKDAMETVARWMMDIARSDLYLLRIEELLPAVHAGKITVALGNSFGNLSVKIFNAAALTDAAPYLQIARKAGFARKSFEKKPDDSAVQWNYLAGSNDDDRVPLTVTMYLSKGEDAACRYVVVGEMTVPDRRLLCGDELRKWEESQNATQ